MSVTTADVVAMAKRYLGVPYVFGGTDPKRGLDCSGLVQLVYKNLGYGLPRLVRNQRTQGSAVSNLKNAQPGDLLVFDGYQHIGIYLGGGKMLHAPQPGEKVKIGNVYATPTSIRRIIGSMPGGNTQNMSGTPKIQKLDMDQLAAKYGYSAAFFKSDKSLWDLINKAINDPNGQWTVDEFQAQLKNTKWYRTNGDSYRQWRMLEYSDPATARLRTNQMNARLVNMAHAKGIAPTVQRMRDMVWRANAYGWDDSQIANAMAAEMKYDPKKAGHYTGEAAINESKIKAMAAAYGVEVSDKTAFNFMQSIVGQDLTEEGMTEYFKKQAKSRYVGLSDDIDRGMTVAEYAQPFIQSQARLLELAPADVNLMDGHIQAALQYKDPKTGVKAPMSVAQFEKSVKADARWTKTKNGRDELMDGAQRVLADWGLSTAGSK